MDAVCAAVVGSARTGRVLDAGSARKDRSSDVCYVGDTIVIYLRKMMTASCTHDHYLCRIVSHRNTCKNVV